MRFKNILLLIVFCLNWSCNKCDDCINNLKYFYERYELKNNIILTYYNPVNNFEKSDTLIIKYTPVSKEYCTNGKEVEKSSTCVGYLHVKFGQFQIKYETSLLTNSNIKKTILFSMIDLDDYRYQFETIDYKFGNRLIKVRHYSIIDTAYIQIKNYCVDCYVSLNYDTIYQYSVKNQPNLWKLSLNKK